MTNINFVIAIKHLYSATKKGFKGFFKPCINLHVFY